MKEGEGRQDRTEQERSKLVQKVEGWGKKQDQTEQVSVMNASWDLIFPLFLHLLLFFTFLKLIMGGSDAIPVKNAFWPSTCVKFSSILVYMR